MPSLRGRAHYPLCQPMGGAVCRDRCGRHRTVGSTISISTFSRRKVKVNKAVPKEAYIQCAEASALSSCCWFSMTDLHEDLQKIQNFSNFVSTNSRQAGLLPIVVGAHSGAFDLVPYDAPEELELGRHQFSVWKTLRCSKRWELRHWKTHSFALFALNCTNDTNEIEWRIRAASSDKYKFLIFPSMHCSRSFEFSGTELDVEQSRRIWITSMSWFLWMSLLGVLRGRTNAYKSHKPQLTIKFRVETYIHLALKVFNSIVVVLQRIASTSCVSKKVNQYVSHFCKLFRSLELLEDLLLPCSNLFSSARRCGSGGVLWGLIEVCWNTWSRNSCVNFMDCVERFIVNGLNVLNRACKSAFPQCWTLVPMRWKSAWPET